MTTADENTRNQENTHRFQERAEQLSRRLGESAQNVWLAGLGALGRMQSEGSKLFDSLVREGAVYERSGKRKAQATAEELREEVEIQFEQARETTTRGWDRLEKVFDARVKSVLRAMHLPNRDEVESLRSEVESLKAQLRANTATARHTTRTGHRTQTTDDTGES